MVTRGTEARIALCNAGETPVLLKIAPDLSLDELDDVVHIARKRKVDGMIVASTVAIVALNGHGRRAMIYPWSLLFFGAIVSTAANTVHAILTVDKMASGIPPIVSALVAAAKHPGIVAVKDAKGDLEASSGVMRETPLSYYSGDDALNLPLLSIGAVGFVSVLLSIAGAACMVTFMTLYGRPLLQAVGTSAGFGPLIAIPGVIGSPSASNLDVL